MVNFESWNGDRCRVPGILVLALQRRPLELLPRVTSASLRRGATGASERRRPRRSLYQGSGPTHLAVKCHSLSALCTRRSHMGWSVQRMLQSAAMGGMIGAGGVVASSLIQGGRLPPRSQIGAAAAMMATVLGVGSVVRS